MASCSLFVGEIGDGKLLEELFEISEDWTSADPDDVDDDDGSDELPEEAEPGCKAGELLGFSAYDQSSDDFEHVHGILPPEEFFKSPGVARIAEWDIPSIEAVIERCNEHTPDPINFVYMVGENDFDDMTPGDRAEIEEGGYIQWIGYFEKD